MTPGSLPLHRTRLTFAMVIAGLMFFNPAQVKAATEMLMFVRPGCSWCELWRKEVGPIYPKSPEALIAPLREVNIASVPPSLKLNEPVVYTPTFIVVHDGAEIGRITGYPGEDFFWSMLSHILMPVASDRSLILGVKP